jgi:hypothetical protein
MRRAASRNRGTISEKSTMETRIGISTSSKGSIGAVDSSSRPISFFSFSSSVASFSALVF